MTVAPEHLEEFERVAQEIADEHGMPLDVAKQFLAAIDRAINCKHELHTDDLDHGRKRCCKCSSVFESDGTVGLQLSAREAGH